MGAYNINYLDNVKSNLGAMLDCGINALGFEPEEFYNMFLVSDMSTKLNKGDCYTICTLGGVELAEYVVCYAMNNSNYIHVKKATDAEFSQRLSEAIVDVDSKEYWAGTVLAEYAWEKNMSFRELNEYISVEDVCGLYRDFGGTDSLMINIRLDEMMRAKSTVARLKVRREAMGFSQSELGRAADIPVRTIQQYEQKQKNINNAKAIYLVRLASALRCEVRELLE